MHPNARPRGRNVTAQHARVVSTVKLLLMEPRRLVLISEAMQHIRDPGMQRPGRWTNVIAAWSDTSPMLASTSAFTLQLGAWWNRLPRERAETLTGNPRKSRFKGARAAPRGQVLERH